MYVCEKDIQKTKARIEKYYQNCRNLSWLQKRLTALSEKLERIEKDMNASKFQFSLKTDVNGVRYDSVIVKGGCLPSSSMEREIERIYNQLEREYEETEIEIIQTNRLIRKLEKENEPIKHGILLLREEARNILQKKHMKKKSLFQISFEMNMSKSTVKRILDSVYLDCSKLFDSMEDVKNVARM